MNCNNKLFKINLVQRIKTVYFVFQISISDRHRADMLYVDIAYFVLTHNLKLSFSTMNCNNKLFKINLVQCIKTVYIWF